MIRAQWTTILLVVIAAPSHAQVPSKLGHPMLQPSEILLAAEFGGPAELNYVLESGLDPNFTSADGWTPLLLAARRSRPELVQVLLLAGAKVDQPTRNGLTPLHISILSKRPLVVAALLAGGADPSASAEGLTATRMAQLSESLEIRKLFAPDPLGDGDTLPGVEEAAEVRLVERESVLREGPAPYFKRLAILKSDEIVWIVGRVASNGWLRVVRESGLSGFVDPLAFETIPVRVDRMVP